LKELSKGYIGINSNELDLAGDYITKLEKIFNKLEKK
jgi:hypothetical protein